MCPKSTRAGFPENCLRCHPSYYYCLGDSTFEIIGHGLRYLNFKNYHKKTVYSLHPQLQKGLSQLCSKKKDQGHWSILNCLNFSLSGEDFNNDVIIPFL